MADFTAKCAGLKDQYGLITEQAKEFPLRHKAEKSIGSLTKRLEQQLTLPDDAKDYALLADLQQSLDAAELEANKIGLSRDDFGSFLDRVQSLISEFGAVCGELMKNKDYGALGAFGTIQNNLRALKAEAENEIAEVQEPPIPSSEFSCQGCPIEATEDLFKCTDVSVAGCAPSLRRMVKGKFTFMELTGPQDFHCVLKCASTAAEPNKIVKQWTELLRYEQGFYARLQAKGANTGCVKCYLPPPNFTFNYLVLEDFGQDLTNLLGVEQRNPQTIMEGIAKAVQALHSHGIMHGDIKPRNILYRFHPTTGAFEAKLCDLDKANIADHHCVAADIGSDYYIPPEVHKARKASERIKASLEMDMYALGLVLWQVANRSARPALKFDEGSPKEAALLQAYDDNDETTVRAFLPFGSTEIAKTYQTFVHRCVVLEPSQRSPAATLFLDVKSISISNMHRKSSMSDVLYEMDRMLHTLLEGTHGIPTLAVILPMVSKGAERFNPMNLMRKNYRLFFLCSQTHRLAPCGPKGMGYEISSANDWVHRAAPVLNVGLWALRSALDFAGRPLPLPESIASLLGIEDLNQDYLNGALNDYFDGAQALVPSSLVESAATLTPEDLQKIQADTVVEGGVTVREGALASYEVIKGVLEKAHYSVANTSGLHKVTYKGYTAWLLHDPEVVKEFLAATDKKIQEQARR